MPEDAKPVFFASAAELRAWMDANHASANELWLGIRKKGSGLASVSYKEAVDIALCFGWIDGAMKSIDATSYRQRFTPRTKRSTWSAVNIARVGELTEAGLMHPAGLDAFHGRDPARANLYSFEQGELSLDPAQEAEFRARASAWTFFQAQPPSYRKQATWWVISAKRPDTRARRLAALIRDCEGNRRLAHLSSPGTKALR